MADLRVGRWPGAGTTVPGPAPAPRGEGMRLAWMDNLRVVVIAGVIVAHAATTYAVDVEWYYQELTTSPLTRAMVTVPWGILALFGLAPLFLVAGALSERSLARKGPGQFLRDRLVRLGIPLAAYTLVIGPLTAYLGGLAEGAPSYDPFRAPDVQRVDTGPMWFVAALLVFSAGYAVWRWLRPAGAGRAGPLLPRHLVAAGALVIGASFAVRLAWPLAGPTPLDLNLWQWPQNAALFGLGALASERGWLDAVSPALRRGCAAAAVAGMLGLAAVFAAVVTDGGEAFLGGWHAQALAEPVAEATLAVAGSIWVVDWFRRRWRQHGPLARTLGRASFATYVLHAPVLVLLAVALRPAPVAAEVKLPVVAVMAVVAGFAVGWLAIKVRPLARVF